MNNIWLKVVLSIWPRRWGKTTRMGSLYDSFRGSDEELALSCRSYKIDDESVTTMVVPVVEALAVRVMMVMTATLPLAHDYRRRVEYGLGEHSFKTELSRFSGLCRVPTIFVPKRTHRVFRRTHRGFCSVSWLSSETVLLKQYSAPFPRLALSLRYYAVIKMFLEFISL